MRSSKKVPGPFFHVTIATTHPGLVRPHCDEYAKGNLWHVTILGRAPGQMHIPIGPGNEAVYASRERYVRTLAAALKLQRQFVHDALRDGGVARDVA